MSDKKHKSELGAETDWIRELAGILEETGLTEIEIEKDAVRLRVSRQGGVAPLAAAPVAQPAPAPASPTASPAPSAPSASNADHPGAVKSPMVGTAYLSPSPGADAFAKEGSTVSEGQTVLIVEAMKTMNPITAPRSGTVTKVLVSDAQPVEFGEPLLIIE
ncbi:acetyl-CoA carboxylase biotin carboxyl carrier protein [Hyphococcus flavus]|uniref:Biotin carboxyl carrier protein of acetyl-CoA carboxylase n=1 Tax=Hyphococcus flavus TaxID=1866326 RepID=A0AAF0CF00_9PROT|nr:acetyl-CoA carboxylase biotin carboxyl carrier protein [Hyphococcus flavus]WDI32021.1 acetyl-CoA carboxylase biotin carboxyl carrier protein [Hyphococcus flavus]